MTPLFRMFLGVLLTVLLTEECYGQTENCRYRNCSHTFTCHCDSGALVLLPCPVCCSIGSTEVTWYYSQTEKSRRELNNTAGGCTLKESGEYENASCSDMRVYQYDLTLTYLEADCDSWWCHIVTPLKLPERCTVTTTSNYTTVCNSGLPVCAYGQSQTDSQCVAQITTTPVLPLTTLSGVTPSASSAPPSSCMLGGVSCHIVYSIVAGLGALGVIVVLLVVVVIVLVCISVKRGKKKIQGTEKAPKEELHTYDVVAQPLGSETTPNDQQHISHRTQHTTHIVDKTQQTHGEYHQENTTGMEYERLKNTRERSRIEEARGMKHDYEQVSTGEQNESKMTTISLLPSHENLLHALEGPIEVSSSRALTTTTAGMYSTPNFSLKEQPQSPGSQDHFYHVLEGPTPPTGTNTYTSADRSTAPGKKEDDNDYDEPVLLTGNKAGHQLFDDPKYQSTFAPVMPTQSHTLPQKLPDRAKIKLLPNLAYASQVKEPAISDSSFQASSPANPTERKWNDMHAFCKDAQEDDYDQPAVITIKNKDLINEGGDQPVLFDDPTYQVASAPV